MQTPSPEAESDTQSAVRDALGRLLKDPLFRSSTRQRRFLEYVVEETLSGRGERLGGYVIGLEVFDKPADFDPTTDAIVRVEAGRLRSKLIEYYSEAGAQDAIEIVLPRGRYRPDFRPRTTQATTGEKGGTPGSPTPVVRAASLSEQGTTTAVLPFVNANGGPSMDYFSDGLAEDLVTELLKVNGLVVLSRHASARAVASSGSPQEIAGELGVEYLVTGSVRYASQQVRVALQLVDGASGQVHWSQHYDELLEQVFDALDRIVIAVATFLKDALTPGEHARLARRGTRSLAAFEAFMKGTYLAATPDSSVEWVERCITHFKQALDADPGYGDALALLSRLEMARAGNGLGNPDEATRRQLQYATDAVALSPGSAPCHAMLAVALVAWRRYDEAIERALHAIELAPGSGEIAVIAGLVLAQGGRTADAQTLLEQGLRVEKQLNPLHAWAAGIVYFATGDHARGRDALREILRQVPQLTAANVLLAAHHMLLGETTQAVALARSIHASAPRLLDPFVIQRGHFHWRDDAVTRHMVDALAEACRLAGIAQA